MQSRKENGVSCLLLKYDSWVIFLCIRVEDVNLRGTLKSKGSQDRTEPSIKQQCSRWMKKRREKEIKLVHEA